MRAGGGRAGPAGYKVLVAAGVLMAIFPATSFAHEGATGVVKERMDLMKSQKNAMKVIGDMAKGKKSFNAAKAAKAARDLEDTTKKIPELFPKGSNHHPSEALDAVWTEWDRFTGDAHDAEAAAKALGAALEGSDRDWKAAFQTMTDACKSCHESFRAEKEHGHH
jgi:cytochrome c556